MSIIRNIIANYVELIKTNVQNPLNNGGTIKKKLLNQMKNASLFVILF